MAVKLLSFQNKTHCADCFALLNKLQQAVAYGLMDACVDRVLVFTLAARRETAGLIYCSGEKKEKVTG